MLDERFWSQARCMQCINAFCTGCILLVLLCCYCRYVPVVPYMFQQYQYITTAPKTCTVQYILYYGSTVNIKLYYGSLTVQVPSIVPHGVRNPSMVNGIIFPTPGLQYSQQCLPFGRQTDNKFIYMSMNIFLKYYLQCLGLQIRAVQRISCCWSSCTLWQNLFY